jgi:hypothetical protein
MIGAFIEVTVQFDLQDTIALLSRTPGTLNSLLRDLPDSWTRRNEGGETFNAYDVVGHLIHGDHEDWIPRARMILDFGETRAFEPFDRRGHVRVIEGKRMPQLLDEFAQLREQKLEELRGMNIKPRDLDRRGKHPALGSVTLAQLLATWAGHDLTHLHQLSRIFASQYREAVGPWSAYLGVLQCNGHSS